jgi:hypothetical protein
LLNNGKYTQGREIMIWNTFLHHNGFLSVEMNIGTCLPNYYFEYLK